MKYSIRVDLGFFDYLLALLSLLHDVVVDTRPDHMDVGNWCSWWKLISIQNDKSCTEFWLLVGCDWCRRPIAFPFPQDNFYKIEKPRQAFSLWPTACHVLNKIETRKKKKNFRRMWWWGRFVIGWKLQLGWWFDRIIWWMNEWLEKMNEELKAKKKKKRKKKFHVHA